LPFFIYVALDARYRLERLRGFMDPWGDPLNSGFHIIQSLVAFGCGGLSGAGVGKGMQKLGFLPQPHTDFIFAVIGEEIGFIGVFILILLFYLVICRGLVVSIKSTDPFLRFVAFGVTVLIGLQAILNMAVAMGLLPTKGLPLPLISLGGTSLVMNLAGLGILMAIARSTLSPVEEVKQ
jgi:cell division protein FtsW